MNLKKKIASLFMLIISAFTLCGCANVEFIRAIDSSNTIIDKLVIEVDESKINKCGKELKDVMKTIESDMTVFRNSIDAWKEQFLVYPELYLKMQKGIYAEVSFPTSNQISIAVQFSDWSMFGLFYGMTEIEDFEYQEALEDFGPFINKIINKEYEESEYGLFLVKYSIIKDTGLINDLENITVNGTNYYEKYSELTNNWYTKDDINFSQIFAYPDERLYSNADVREVEGGMTFLKWDFSDKSTDFEMKIYKLAPRSISWYILALIITAIVITVLIIVIYKKSKKGNVTVKITKQEVEKDER